MTLASLFIAATVEFPGHELAADAVASAETVCVSFARSAACCAAVWFVTFRVPSKAEDSGS